MRCFLKTISLGYNLCMLSSIVTTALGFLLFLFLFWKKLKEDYPSDFIFSTAILVLLGVVSGALASAKFLPSWWFWFSILGSFLGFLVGLFRFRLRFFEGLEALIISLLPLSLLIFLGDAIKNSSLSSLVYSVGTLGLFGLYYFLNAHYKNFTWYRSGRVGFAGLSTGGLFFLLRAGIAIFSPTVLSFVDKFEVMLSGIAAFTLFLLVFNLGRSEV